MTTPTIYTPGTVLAVRGSGWTGNLIRAGAALLGKPNLSAHIAVVHHTDAKGTTWAISGQPGGVGWEDTARYLADPWTITNADQPLTPTQASGIATTMETLIGTGYDWDAIAADAEAAFGIILPGWDPSWHGTVPGHVVCSSIAAYAYAKKAAACPKGDRGVTPGDWDQFIIRRGWET
jgi:hypothetical protein